MIVDAQRWRSDGRPLRILAYRVVRPPRLLQPGRRYTWRAFERWIRQQDSAYRPRFTARGAGTNVPAATWVAQRQTTGNVAETRMAADGWRDRPGSLPVPRQIEEVMLARPGEFLEEAARETV
jgi:hypothetical protein